MDLMDLLAKILNPNPGVVNQMTGTSTGLGPEQLARYHQQSGMGTAPQGAPPAAFAASPAPVTQQHAMTAQQPPQAAPAPSGGGGIGGFLSGLFQDPEARQKNHTVQWLTNQGMDEGTATMMASHKPSLQAFLLERAQGGNRKPLEVNGRLVDPNTYEVLADFSDKSSQGRRTTTIDGKLIDTDTGQVVGDYGTPEPKTRDLTPEEVAKRGLVPGNYQEDAEGNLKVIGTPREQGADFGRLQDVRKEIQQLPSYKNFSQAAPIYDTMVDAASRDSKAADLNLVYGLGKIFDPGSVVREGEMVMVKDTASLPDWLVGAINGLNGGARLQAETRRAILQEAQSRIKAYQGMLDSDLTQYRSLADTYKLNPDHLLPPLPKIRDLPNGAPQSGGILPLPPQGTSPAPAPSPMQSPAPQGGVTDWKDWLAPKRGR